MRRARSACADLPNVRFLAHDLRSGGFPERDFDLLVFSDVLYYFSTREIIRLVDQAAEATRPGGSFLLANGWQEHFRGLTNPDTVLEKLRASGRWREASLARDVLANGMQLTIARFVRI